jgi:hypothetical protein
VDPADPSVHDGEVTRRELAIAWLLLVAVLAAVTLYAVLQGRPA